MDITQWNSTLWCVVILIWRNVRAENSFTGVSTLVHEYIGRTTTENLRTVLAGDEVLSQYPGSTKPTWDDQKQLSLKSSKHKMGDVHSTVQYTAASSVKLINITDDLPLDTTVKAVQFVEQPTGLKVTPLPLVGADHELTFNVSWDPPSGGKVQAYSLEVHSETNTIDCRLSNFCYESNIPGESAWSLIPAFPSPAADGCALRPGCAYWVKLIASPWDGHSYVDMHVQLDECVEDVCSCAHSPRLPRPAVSATTISVHGDLFANVTWSLPVPSEPLRLPPRLRKQYYLISIGKEIVLPNAQNGRTWYTPTVTRRFDALGFVVIPEALQWRLLPITERSGARSGDGPTRSIVLDVKLEARVSLVDERGCQGPAGNATAYDPAEPKTPIPVPGFQLQALWAVIGGACVLVMIVILAFSARAIKGVLKEFRPEPVPAALQPLRSHPNWLPVDA